MVFNIYDIVIFDIGGVFFDWDFLVVIVFFWKIIYFMMYIVIWYDLEKDSMLIDEVYMVYVFFLIF